jgi:carbamoylphosphate synthase small subunit
MMEIAAKQASERAREQGGRMKAELGGVVVLDFGGQYTQLIARRIREQQVFSAVLPCTSSIEEIRKLEPAGIILSGGPSSVYDADAPKCDPKVLALGIPVLGMGKVKAAVGTGAEEVERLAQADAVIAPHLAGKSIVKRIFVPDKLLNLVVA